MRPLRIIGYIIEIIVAIALFVILAQKTPLFDRVIPGRSSEFSTNSINNTGDIQNTNNTTGDNTNTTGSTTNLLPINSDIPLTVQVYDTGPGCITPWGSKIANNQSITSYQTNQSDKTNTCLSEIRVCKNGKLSGSYPYQGCDFFIDGKRNGKEIIPGANNSTQQFGQDGVLLQQNIKKNKEYLQPTISKDNTQLTYEDTQGRTMENSKIAINNLYTEDILEQEAMTHDHTQAGQNSCTAPRGKQVPHGKVIYAYDRDTSNIYQFCKSEARACINGKLTGSYRYKDCDIGVNQNDKESSTMQTLSRTENTRLANIPRQSKPNGMTSPGGPQRSRPLSETILNEVNIGGYVASYNGGNTNYINESRACISPWGTEVNPGEYILAYRTESSEPNSLCDSEQRLCRNGILGGSFSYANCNETKRNEKENIITQTKKALSTSKDKIEKAKNEIAERKIWDTISDTVKKIF